MGGSRNVGAVRRGEHGDAVAVSRGKRDGDEEVRRPLLRGIDRPEARGAGEIDVQDYVTAHNTARVVIALEGEVDDGADGTAGSITAHDVLEGGLLDGAVGMSELCIHAIAVLG